MFLTFLGINNYLCIIFADVFPLWYIKPGNNPGTLYFKSLCASPSRPQLNQQPQADEYKTLKIKRELELAINLIFCVKIF